MKKVLVISYYWPPSGGFDNITPGEISLAHNGILFIDEFCEMPQKTIEVLRGRNDGGHRGTSSGGKTAAKGTLCR